MSAPMLGRRHGRNRCTCCMPHKAQRIDVARGRRHEKRETEKWADEYVDPVDVELGACPKGGPDCGCEPDGDGT